MSFRGRNTRALLPFGLDYADVSGGLASQSQDTHLSIPIHGDLSEREENSAKQSIALAQSVADGPFFTGDATEKGASQSSLTTNVDGIKRHSDKYKKTKKIGRTIEEHPYELEFFPEELYSVMGISNKQKRKLLSLSSYKADGGLREFGGANPPEEDNESMAQSMLDKLKNLAETLDDDKDKEDENADDLEEDFDDEFEEDDDDDYNAEKYFDDGDEDGVDGGDDEAAF
ncbi:DNA-directed RNA polymerase III subunit RPC7 [[Candida] anglica]|uniref:DNA-directed RNA polymerase III subunit n=1 Tax=[Candida] anglica TaxID=148631 RepID=A0ABP0EF40_9ASCO